MTRRYPALTVALGGGLSLVGSIGEWPAVFPTLEGLSMPIIGVGLLLIVLAVIRMTVSMGQRVQTVGILLVAVVSVVLGMAGYMYVLIGDVGELWPSIVLFCGGAIAVAGGLADWFDLPPAGATRRLKGTILMATVGLGGLVAMFIWALALFQVSHIVLGRAPTFAEEMVISVVSLGFGMGTVAVLYLFAANHEWSFIDLRVPSLIDAGWTVVGLGGLFAALIIIGLGLEAIGAPAAEHDLVERLEDADPNVILYVLIPASILIIGPGEELLFRNIIQKSLYTYFSRSMAVVVASILFALVHIPAYWAGAETVTALLVITVLSLILGGIYARTENIIVPSIIHGGYNAILFGILYVEVTTDETIAVLALIGM